MRSAPVVATERLAGFAHFLRQQGFHVGPGEQNQMLRALRCLPSGASPNASAAWRAIACGNARQWHLWPELFEQFWFPHRIKGSVKVSGQTRPRRDLRSLVQQIQDQAADAGSSTPGSGASKPSPSSDSSSDSTAPAVEKAQAGASAVEVDALHDRSQQMWMPEDLHRLQRLAQQIHRQLQPRPTRRWTLDPRGHRLDIRQTLRASLAHGGLPLNPAWSRRKTVPPRLFLLADVSRSMETHAAFYLRLCRAFVQQAQARAFVFHVRLSEVTPLLLRDSPYVQEKINAVTAGFGSGTRIASNLSAMVRQHARAQLRRPCHVWIMSDGYDTDPPEQLRQSLLQLKQHGARITWFHPNAQRPNSHAIQHAKSCIDRFIPLAQLADLQRAQHLLH
jgi:uncharacterized protein